MDIWGRIGATYTQIIPYPVQRSCQRPIVVPFSHAGPRSHRPSPVVQVLENRSASVPALKSNTVHGALIGGGRRDHGTFPTTLLRWKRPPVSYNTFKHVDVGTR